LAEANSSTIASRPAAFVSASRPPLETPRRSLYVHIEGPATAAIQKLGDAVAVGGTLLIIGHRPIDPATGAPTRAAGQTQISVEEAVAALDAEHWEMLVAEALPRTVAGSGVDAVVHARRLA